MRGMWGTTAEQSDNGELSLIDDDAYPRGLHARFSYAEEVGIGVAGFEDFDDARGVEGRLDASPAETRMRIRV